MIADWLRILRPAHWVKNLFVLAPLLFAQQLFDHRLWAVSAAAAGLFCLLSAGVYAFNDVLDAERDRLHPLKARRPVAAGRISARRALAVACCLAGLAVCGAFNLQFHFGLVCVGYLVLNVLYSVVLKRVAFVDVAIIATGFVLRVVGGALAISVVISGWVVVCTFFLACLLGFGKRRHELAGVGAAEPLSRPALGGYSLASLKWAERLAAAITVLAYLAYTIAPGTVAKFGSHQLVFTLPFPVFGIIRYLQLVESRHDRSPTEALVTDFPSVFNLAAWVAVVVIALY